MLGKLKTKFETGMDKIIFWKFKQTKNIFKMLFFIFFNEIMILFHYQTGPMEHSERRTV